MPCDEAKEMTEYVVLIIYLVLIALIAPIVFLAFVIDNQFGSDGANVDCAY